MHRRRHTTERSPRHGRAASTGAIRTTGLGVIAMLLAACATGERAEVTPAIPAATSSPDDAPQPLFSPQAATSTTTTTSTTIAPSTTPVPPPTTLPAPVAPPATDKAPTVSVAAAASAPPAAPIDPPDDPRGFEPEVRLGTIAIPSLGVEEPLLEGIRLTTLDKAPGHWPGTAMPGEVGNVVVAAHRTSHGGPFRNIDQLIPGDLVVFDTEAGRVEYSVVSTEIVQPDAIWIVDPTETATATLFACHPPGSVRERIVVKLELV